MTELAAQPKYARGETVVYTDQHRRQQTGQVICIEATWAAWGTAGRPPLIVYTVTHPTYRNHRMYAGEDDIHYAVKSEANV